MQRTIKQYVEHVIHTRAASCNKNWDVHAYFSERSATGPCRSLGNGEQLDNEFISYW